ncbi:type 1 fimbrial protein [Salmonella enterica]|nr:type 1 fimbrial protein [Salmonella enterica]EJX2519855.1 type 1 fimbrial protein [Salmonella enterica]
MKIKNCLFLLGTAMAVMSSSAFADTTGTQTFTANVVANTCTVDNLNKTVDLGTVHFSDFITQGTWHYKKGIGVNEIFKVTNCPNALTKVQVVPTFNVGPGDDMVKNTGTAGDMYIWFNKTIDGIVPAAADVWHSGKAREFNLTAGGADIPVNGLLLQASNAKNPGTLDFQMTFAFDFV